MALSTGTNVVIISIVFSLLAIALVLVRFQSRTNQRVAFGIDDYLIVPATFLTVGIGIANSISSIAGSLGQHVQLSPEGKPEYTARTVIFMKCLFCTTLLSTPALALTKCSIVCFYRRLFPGPRFNIASWATIVLVALWGLAMFLANLLTCRPISGNWGAFTAAPAEAMKGAICVNPVPRYWTSGVLDVFTDVVIFILPQPLVWRLQMSTSKKVGVSAIFSVGAFVIAIGAVKIAFFVEAGKAAAHSYDVTYDQAPTLYWTQLECAVAVICACLPTLRVNVFTITVNKLRSYASKVSLRDKGSHPSRRSPASQPSLPQWERHSKDTSTDSKSPFQPAVYKAEAISLSSIDVSQHHPVNNSDSAIYVQREVYQQRVGAGYS
ncbi:hypothetical protein VM1G_07440 [Cytospora mali]|uniref:Rhodopsin domain-containing protein n=1 Tax=Cytospora mali TaxID=578113 RepID=A0A194W7I8_CYTMA|nr:hypothetical protein VM1G_07440 [Valsa mali]